MNDVRNTTTSTVSEIDFLKAKIKSLEKLIKQRTTDLSQINEQLKQEIAMRKQTGEALRKSEKRYRSVVENQTEMVCRYLPDSTLTFVNGAFCNFFDKNRGELVGQKLFSLYPEEKRKGIQDHLDSLVENPLIVEFEQYLDLPNEEPLWLQWVDNPVCNDSGKVIEFISVGRDITDRKELERVLGKHVTDLARSNAELEQFAYVASHDLYEPLRMVTGYLKLLEKRYQHKLDDTAKTYIDFAVDGAKRMKQLINDLLDYSRVGKQNKPFQEININMIVDTVMLNLQKQIEEQNTEICYENLPTVYGDQGQLTQLFQNLISNAIKFRSAKTPKIHISSNKKNNRWQIKIQDNGIGIDPKFFDRIFMIFQRLHSRDEYPGTGIGLAYCKKIIENHDGQIRVESKPGEGSIFDFTLKGKP